MPEKSFHFQSGAARKIGPEDGSREMHRPEARRMLRAMRKRGVSEVEKRDYGYNPAIISGR
jgi:hypothetical protein